MNLDFLKDSVGTPSSKRYITFGVFILICVYFFTNLFTGKVLDANLWSNLCNIFYLSFVGVATEKAINNIAKKNDSPKSIDVQTENVNIS